MATIFNYSFPGTLSQTSDTQKTAESGLVCNDQESTLEGHREHERITPEDGEPKTDEVHAVLDKVNAKFGEICNHDFRIM